MNCKVNNDWKRIWTQREGVYNILYPQNLRVLYVINHGVQSTCVKPHISEKSASSNDK